MHVVDGRRARALVQIVDVLGAKEQIDRPRKLRQRGVRRVGRGVEQVAPARVVESVDRGGVAGEGLRRRELHGVELRPDAARVAEGAEAAFGRDTGAGEDEDPHQTASKRPGRTAASPARCSGVSAVGSAM